MRAGLKPKSIALEATIIRADGKVEPQGVVAYWHANPFKRMLARRRGVKGVVNRARSHPSS